MREMGKTRTKSSLNWGKGKEKNGMVQSRGKWVKRRKGGGEEG